MYTLLQAIGLPRHRRSQLGGGAFPVLSENHRIFFCKMKKKFLNSSMLDVGVVMGYAKVSCF